MEVVSHQRFHRVWLSAWSLGWCWGLTGGKPYNLVDQLNSGWAHNVRNASLPHVCLFQLVRFYVRFPAKTCTVDRLQSVYFISCWCGRPVWKNVVSTDWDMFSLEHVHGQQISVCLFCLLLVLVVQHGCMLKGHTETKLSRASVWWLPFFSFGEEAGWGGLGVRTFQVLLWNSVEMREWKKHMKLESVLEMDVSTFSLHSR